MDSARYNWRRSAEVQQAVWTATKCKTVVYDLKINLIQRITSLMIYVTCQNSNNKTDL